MFRRSISLILIATFICSVETHSNASLLGLPEPGAMVSLSPAYQPAMIKGLTVHKDNPFLFDFIVDRGDNSVIPAKAGIHSKMDTRLKLSGMTNEQFKQEGEKLIKYFLASLAIPEKDLWVNLSPYEKDRIIPQALGQTDMGRDLLAQDYMLKQITASLIYPEKGLGKEFWNRVYAKAGNAQIPVNVFNKVWIMADKAEVFERNQTVFVVSCHLKVMLEEDYLAYRQAGLAITKNNVGAGLAPAQNNRAIPGLAARTGARVAPTKEIICELILPELEREVNTGKNFANLRQITNSLILATWYKKNLKQALLNQVYSDKEKMKGIDLQDKTVTEHIYQRYLQAYKKGVFNYIKEEFFPGDRFSSQPYGSKEIGPLGGALTSRKYFSGGWIPNMVNAMRETTDPSRLRDLAMQSNRLVNITAGARIDFMERKSLDAAMTPKMRDPAMRAANDNNTYFFPAIAVLNDFLSVILATTARPSEDVEIGVPWRNFESWHNNQNNPILRKLFIEMKEQFDFRFTGFEMGYIHVKNIEKFAQWLKKKILIELVVTLDKDGSAAFNSSKQRKDGKIYRTDVDHGPRHAADLLEKAIELANAIKNSDPEGQQEYESIQWDVLIAAIVLHDIFAFDDIHHGPDAIAYAEHFLARQGMSPEKIKKVQDAIRWHDVRNDMGKSEREKAGIESKILFDVDQLEAFGAKGVFRFTVVYYGRYMKEVEKKTKVEGDFLAHHKAAVLKNLEERWAALAFDASRKYDADYQYLKSFFQKFDPLDANNGATGPIQIIIAHRQEHPTEFSQTAIDELSRLEAQEPENEEVKYAKAFFEKLAGVYKQENEFTRGLENLVTGANPAMQATELVDKWKDQSIDNQVAALRAMQHPVGIESQFDHPQIHINIPAPLKNGFIALFRDENLQVSEAQEGGVIISFKKFGARVEYENGYLDGVIKQLNETVTAMLDILRQKAINNFIASLKQSYQSRAKITKQWVDDSIQFKEDHIELRRLDFSDIFLKFIQILLKLDGKENVYGPFEVKLFSDTKDSLTLTTAQSFEDFSVWLQGYRPRILNADGVMVGDAAMPGGIDLNTEKTAWTDRKQGAGVEITVDSAMIERVRREGIGRLDLEIYSITPVVSIWPLIGLKASPKG